METLTAHPFIEKSQMDFNQIAKLVMNHITESVTENVLSGVKFLLENHFPVKEEKEEYLTQKQARERLGISRSAFFQREKRGQIKRDGNNGRPLYSVKQIENFIKKTNSSIQNYDFTYPLN